MSAVDAAMPADAALAIDDLGRLLDPAPIEHETGWCRLPDGVMYASVRTPMPGVSAEMIDWWFDWHPRDPERYRMWFPGAHESVSLREPERPDAKRHWGATHYPVEDIGLGMQRLRIDFLPPTALGFSTDALDDPRVGTIVCGLVGDLDKRAQHTLMTHVFLRDPEGLVLRSRFWIGARLRPYLPSAISGPAAALLNRPLPRKLLVPDRAGAAMCRHCATEYANLAELLPGLYGEFGPGA